MSKASTSKPASAISYEKARDELAEIVSQLEGGDLGLEESIKIWERGEELVKICQEWLDGAKARIEKAKDGREDGGSDA